MVLAVLVPADARACTMTDNTAAAVAWAVLIAVALAAFVAGCLVGVVVF